MATEIPHSDPATVNLGAVELVYDTFGDRDDAPFLLIMGLGAQMIAWDELFCEALAAANFYVIRFDNRDVGHSTKLDGAGLPNMAALLQGEAVEVPYLLDDLATDAVGLLDALEIKSAHVLGASMGGMIAQIMAVEYPRRVRTLTCLATSSQAPGLADPTPEAMQLLTSPPPPDRSAFLDQAVSSARLLNGKVPFDEARARERAAAEWERGIHPAGTARQFAAVLSSNWHERLAKLEVPTLVIHGQADPLLPLAHGVDIAERVPDARLLVIDDAGHSFPPQLWEPIIEAVAQHAGSHERKRA